MTSSSPDPNQPRRTTEARLPSRPRSATSTATTTTTASGTHSGSADEAQRPEWFTRARRLATNSAWNPRFRRPATDRVAATVLNERELPPLQLDAEAENSPAQTGRRPMPMAIQRQLGPLPSLSEVLPEELLARGDRQDARMQPPQLSRLSGAAEGAEARSGATARGPRAVSTPVPAVSEKKTSGGGYNTASGK